MGNIGRELTDAQKHAINTWIACEFFKFSRRNDGMLAIHPTRAIYGVPHYTNDMNLAMELANEIRKEYGLTIGDVVFRDRWIVHIYNEPDLPYYKADVEHEDPATAICLGAMQLRGISLKEIEDGKWITSW